MDLSTLEAGATKLSEERFDFIELVETVSGRLLIDTPNTKYQLTYKLPDKKIFIFADKNRMEQVLNNLILNAKNHTCDGAKIHLMVIQWENTVKFSIFNQGKQIPVQDITKIWTKFYRGKNVQNKKYTGSGLGLSIVAQILSIYQADYGVQNISDGVEFYFYFPTIT